MATVRIVISDHTRSKKTTVELPDDVSMRRLLPALATRMQLPLQQAGNPIIYRLDNRRTGQRLDDEDTLRSVDVAADDEFTLLPEVTAGGTSIDDIQIGATHSVTPPQRRPGWGSGEIGPQPVMIRLPDEVFRVIEREASATLDEVGGILIGKAVKWDGTLYVDIEAALPGERTKAGPAHITFTADTWAALLRRKEEELPKGWIVGWFHSHPRMGIFLSDLDVSLHRNFFPQPWHVALVIDAQARERGFFARSGEEIRAVPHVAWSRAKHRRTSTWIWIWISAIAVGIAAFAALLKGKRS